MIKEGKERIGKKEGKDEKERKRRRWNSGMQNKR